MDTHGGTLNRSIMWFLQNTNQITLHIIFSFFAGCMMYFLSIKSSSVSSETLMLPLYELIFFVW